MTRGITTTAVNERMKMSEVHENNNSHYRFASNNKMLDVDMCDGDVEKNDPYMFQAFDDEEDVDMRDESHRRHEVESVRLKPVLSQHSSRRKQSKPFRVQHTEGGETDTIPSKVTRLDDESPDPNYQGGRERISSYSSENIERPVSFGDSSPENYAAYEAARLQHDSDTEQRLAENDDADRAENPFGYPTEYHRLGRQLFSGDDDIPNDLSMHARIQNPEDGVPVKRGSNGGSPKWIFHQDAYCELCDREFCNKYFLKTHKANKHGIYDSINSAQVTPSRSPSMFPMYLSPDLPTMVPQSEPTHRALSDSPPVYRRSQYSPLNMSRQSTPPFSTTSTAFNKPSTPPSRMNYDSMDSMAENLSREMDNQPSKPGTPKNGDGSDKCKDGEDQDKQKQRSMEDFCDLCQKHFCNKYYLRKHKMDVHGIQSDPFSIKRRQSMNSNADLQHLNNLAGNSPVLLPQSIPHSMANIMLFNPFGPLMGMPHNPSMMHPHLPPLNSLTYPIPSPLERPPSHQKQGREAGETIRANGSSDSIRNIGVKNADAYCEICRKEFCDKYYLKVHKANMHNIILDDSPNRSHMGPFSSPFSPNEPNPSSARPESGDAYRSDGVAKKMELENEQNSRYGTSHEPKTDSSYDNRIESEKKPEQNFKHEPHYEQQSDLPMDFSKHASPNRREQPLPEDHHQRHNHSAHRHDHPKVEKPRTCEICNKEFADKYALRMHRLNIHGQVSASGRHPAGSSCSDRANETKHDFTKAEHWVPSSIPNMMSSLSSMPQTYQMSLSMGMPPTSLSMPLPSSMSLSFPPPTDSNSNDMGSMPTMFGSMVAAKLADRVTCDICNKEVCNKYFLKTHKIKMHGLDPALVRDTPKPERSESKTKVAKVANINPMSSVNMNNNGTPEKKMESPTNVREATMPSIDPENPNRNEDLLRMGIDPEAYCDICKKEFCSKYFLRTHKLKMHGIPTDKPGNRKEDREISRREMMEREMFAMRELNSTYPSMNLSSLYPAGFETMLSRPSQMPSMQQSNQDQSSHRFLPFPPMDTSVKKDFDEESLDSSGDKSNKSNKEPANMIRVKCEICNKELCNKYFLRTHKLNKHGIVDEALSEGQQRKFLEMQRNMPIDSPFWMNSEHRKSMEEYNKEESRNFGAPTMGLDGVFGALESKLMMNNAFESSHKREQSLSIDNRLDGHNASHFYREYSEVCHICQRRFTNPEFLETHMYVEHNSSRDNRGPGHFRRELALPCQICGMLFPDRIGLQIHMVQEHDVQINVTPEQPPQIEQKPRLEEEISRPQSANGTLYRTPPLNSASALNISLTLRRKYSRQVMRSKLYSCSHCEYKTRRLTNIESHEERKHGIIRQAAYECNTCSRTFRFRQSLQKHSRLCQQSDGLHSVATARRFRCAFCPEKFNTRRECRIHIFDVHKSKRRFKCEDCSFCTNNAKRLLSHARVEHAKNNIRPALVPVNGLRNGELNGCELDRTGEKTPVCYAKPCDLKSQASFIMQPFTLRDENTSRFVKAVVYLPVFEKINEARSVSFQLTPTE